MSDRRGPPPPRDYAPYPPGPPRDYERPPPIGDYRRPLPPRSPPGFDSRRGPPPPRDGYDDYRGPPPPRLRSPEPGFDGRAKRRRSLSPGPPPRRGGGDYYEPREYPPRDGHYRPGPPPPSNYRGDYPPGPPPLAGRPPRGPPGPPLRGGPPEDFHRGPPPPAAYYPPPPHAAAREPEAPHHLPYIVTHRYFSDWFTRTNPPALADSAEALELAWKKYLAEYMRRSLRPQFEELRGMKWFEEKYGVGEDREGEREKRKEEGRKGRVGEWCEAAERGEWETVTSEFDEEALAAPTTSDQNGDTKMNESTDADKEKKEENKEKPKKPQPVLGDGLIPLTPETVLIPSRPNRIIIDSIPSHIAYSQLHEVFSPLEGFDRLSTGDGQPFANWVRTGWVTFDTEENATKALEALNDTSIGDYKLSLNRQDQPVETKIRAAPAAMSAPDRLKKDLATVETIIEYLEKDEKKDGEEQKKLGSDVIRAMKEGWEKEVEVKREKGEDVTKDEIEVVRKTLDFSLHYLRFAFHTCYYCATRSQSAEALEGVCARHVRRIGAPLPSDLPFVKGLDEKLPLLDDLEKLDLRDFGAELKEEVLYSLCQPHIKIEEEGKFRCKECNKLFSARKFVEKHILTKHGHFVNDAIKQVEFFNNYILDSAHHPIADFQRMNFLPSLLNPPPPAPTLADRIGGRRAPNTNGSNGSDNKRQKREGNPPPPPKGATLDPRAARVPSSYADLDGTPGGAPDVVELPY